MTDRESLQSFLSYIKPFWKNILMVSVSLLASTLLSLSIPWIIGVQLIDKVILEESLSLEVVMLMFIGAILGKELFDFLNDYFMELLAENISHDLRTQFYDHLQHVPLSFLDRSYTGDLLARISSDVNTVANTLNSLISDLGTNLFTLLGIIFFLFTINVDLTFMVLPTLPVLLFVVSLFRGRIKRTSKIINKAKGDLMARASEVLSGVRVVRSFVKEEEESRVFSNKSMGILRSKMGLMKLSAIYSSSVSLIVLTGMVLVIWFGTPMAMTGTITVGSFFVYLNYIRRIHSPVKGLSKANFKFQKALAAADRLFYLNSVPERSLGPGLVELPPIEGHIKFADVSFGYLDRDLVLRNFNLEIQPKEVVAIVGSSGCGKTTIMNLLLGFYEVEKGEITVDGYPIDEVDLKSLRSQIGVVSQETFLFSGTVGENIGYGKEAATEEEIQHAAKLANAHDFIVGLPRGYDSKIGERGVNLSSGQKQRIAIARALIKDPKILILDEATSNVDSASELLIQEALEQNMKEKTTIIIGHRLSTVMRAQKIITLEKGKIVETGTHQELLDNQGVYARLFTI